MTRRKFDRVMIDVEAGRSLKLRPLDDSEFRCFIAGVLPIAAKSPERGCLLIGSRRADSADIAVQSGVRRRKAASSALTKLRDLGILYEDECLNCERVHDFEEWNPPPKFDATNAERQRRHRERLSRNAPSNASRNGVTNTPVTPGREEKVEGKTPPKPPQGGRQRDNALYREELRDFAASAFPGAALPAATAAVEQAVRWGDAQTVDDVRAFVEAGDFPSLRRTA